MFDWHDRSFREKYEIEQFIMHYKRLHGVFYEIVKKSEMPDYILQAETSEVTVGVELTSVYLDKRSVPLEHMSGKTVSIPFDKDKIIKYEFRLLEAVGTKIKKARLYDQRQPLLLSVYVNEYISIYMDDQYWLDMAYTNLDVFDNISPFREIIFWPLPDNQALSVRNGQEFKIG